MAGNTGPFLQNFGKIYAGTAGVPATTLVTTANEIAKLNGNVALNVEWMFAEARWRQKALQDRVAYAIDGTIACEDVEFKASTATVLFTASSGAGDLFGAGTGTNSTSAFWRITASTVPRKMQFVFEFRRSDNNRKMQIYAPKAMPEAFNVPFNEGDLTKHPLAFKLLASSSGRMVEMHIAVSSTY